MGYKLRYIERLITDGDFKGALRLIQAHCSDAENTLIVQLAREVHGGMQGANAAVRSTVKRQVAQKLMELNTPDATQILTDHYFEQAIIGNSNIDLLHQVDYDPFREKLLRYIEQNYHLKSGGTRRHHMYDIVLAAARTDDVRFVPFLKREVEQNTVAFKSLVPASHQNGIIALHALTLMTLPEARQIVDLWRSYWHQYLTAHLAGAAIHEIGSSFRTYSFLYEQAPVVNWILAHVAEDDFSLRKNDYDDALSRMLQQFTLSSAQDDFFWRLMTFADNQSTYFLRKKILAAAARLTDHPAITEFAVRHTLYRPLTYMVRMCLAILVKQQFVSLPLAQTMRDELDSYAYLQSDNGVYHFGDVYLRYLSMVDDPVYDDAVLRYLRRHQAGLSAETVASVAGTLAVRDDQAFNFLVGLLDDVDDRMRRAAVRVLTGIGERGVPVLQGVLAAGSDLAQQVYYRLTDHHAPLIPYLLPLAIQSDGLRRIVVTVLQRIGTDAAYEALLTLYEMDGSDR